MAATGNKRPMRRELTPGCDLIDSRRTPTNPNNYIWSTYLRRPTIEDRVLMAGVLLAVGWIGTLAWRALASCFRDAPPPAPLGNNNQEDLFKNW